MIKLIVDRISERAKIKTEDDEKIYISSYEVIEKITEEVIKEYRETVNGMFQFTPLHEG